MSELPALIASFRDQLAAVERRRAEIERQRADVEREYVRLASGLSLLEEHVRGGRPAPAADAAADDRSVTDRVYDLILAGVARTRGEILRQLLPLGVKENGIDSALTRLKRQQRIAKQGRVFVALDPPTPVPPAPSPEVPSSSS